MTLLPGLQPVGTRALVNAELDKWSKRYVTWYHHHDVIISRNGSGVQGHHDDSVRPWVTIEETVNDQSAKLVGACTVPNSTRSLCHMLD